MHIWFALFFYIQNDLIVFSVNVSLETISHKLCLNFFFFIEKCIKLKVVQSFFVAVSIVRLFTDAWVLLKFAVFFMNRCQMGLVISKDVDTVSVIWVCLLTSCDCQRSRTTRRFVNSLVLNHSGKSRPQWNVIGPKYHIYIC